MAVLDLDHFNSLENLKAMAAGGEQNDVAGRQLAALEIFATIGVKIHAQPAAPQDQDFARELNRALHLVMDMRFNHVSGWMAHISELLGKIARREKMNTRFVEITMHDDCELHSVKAHSLNHE